MSDDSITVRYVGDRTSFRSDPTGILRGDETAAVSEAVADRLLENWPFEVVNDNSAEADDEDDSGSSDEDDADADNSEEDTITDLMNADLAEHTVSEIREAQARVELTEDERQTLTDRERDGKDRESAVDVLEP